MTKMSLVASQALGKESGDIRYHPYISGGMVRNRDVFIATEGQTVFNLKAGHTYEIGQNKIDVEVGGVPQFSPNHFTETSSTSFTLSEGVPNGTEVIATCYTVAQPLNNNSENQLLDLTKKIEVTPDDFFGMDIQKVQAAYDFCIANKIPTMKLNRTYNLTGGSIKIPAIDWAGEVSIYGGTLKKEDSGFMFTRDTNNNEINGPSFFGTKFYGHADFQAVILDGDRMIRSTFENCYFKAIALTHTTIYTQSLRVLDCEMWESTSSFIKGPLHLDLMVSGNKFETSPNHFLEAVNPSTEQYALTSIRINENLFEGYTTVSPLKISSALGLTINNNYFELNKTHIEFVNEGGIGNIAGEIHGNSFFRNMNDVDISFQNNLIHKLSIQNNSSNIGSAEPKCFMNKVGSFGLVLNNNLYYGGNLYPTGSLVTERSLELLQPQLSILDTTLGTGLKVTIPKFMPDGYATLDMLGRSYLINISATLDLSFYYRASYTGILTIAGVYSTTLGETAAKVLLTHLNMSGVSGDTNGAQGVDTDVVVKFLNADSNVVPTLTYNEGIVIEFPQLFYRGTAGAEAISIKPIENIFLESTELTRQF